MNVEKVKTWIYVLMGALVSVTAVIQIARIGSMDYANAGSGYEMDAIAAVVVGGTSMAGGKGSIIGTVLGMLIIAVMNNLLNLMGVPPFLREAFKGFIVIAAVLLQKKEAAELNRSTWEEEDPCFALGSLAAGRSRRCVIFRNMRQTPDVQIAALTDLNEERTRGAGQPLRREGLCFRCGTAGRPVHRRGQHLLRQQQPRRNDHRGAEGREARAVRKAHGDHAGGLRGAWSRTARQAGKPADDRPESAAGPGPSEGPGVDQRAGTIGRPLTFRTPVLLMAARRHGARIPAPSTWFFDRKLRGHGRVWRIWAYIRPI